MVSAVAVLAEHTLTLGTLLMDALEVWRHPCSLLVGTFLGAHHDVPETAFTCLVRLLIPDGENGRAARRELRSVRRSLTV